jgi:steroid delta-isomerase-like uncharacterized protein
MSANPVRCCRGSFTFIRLWQAAFFSDHTYIEGRGAAMAQETDPVAVTEAHRALVKRFIEDFWAGGNLSRVEEFLAPVYVEHNLLPGQTPGLEGYKRRFLTLRAALPDVRISIDDILAEGDRVMARVTIVGTHLGPFLGQPASGHVVRMAAINIYRIADSRIVERWGVQDVYGLLRQMTGDEVSSR